jgi:NADH-quinone oxidoreductase subunit L
MEGPTPVSALIHAATMVTAGVYLLCRMVPLMGLHPLALPAVAWVGGLTALLAATIGMAQHDVKRIFAYSTISQLGYMFLGVGLLTTVGAAYHVFNHAFFKAVLFLTAGAVMHGFAGQVDLRKVSGLARMPGWRVVAFTMLYACLCLAGFPIITSGYASKDAIMAEAFVHHGYGYRALGVIAVVTAGLTAYYTFRVWFRVCAGPVHFEPGDEHYGEGHGHGHGGAFHPHAPRWAINGVLLVISAGAVASIFLGDWVAEMVSGSSAAAGMAPAAAGTHGEGFWADPHGWMPWVASAAGILGIAVAWYFHLQNRRAADAVKEALLSNPATRWLPVAMERKWYVDEVYAALIVRPLWWLGKGLNGFDRYVVDWFLVDKTASLPRTLGRGLQPLQNGVLQSYGLSMMGGAVLVALLVFYLPGLMPQIVEWIEGLWATGGAGTALSAGGGP